MEFPVYYMTIISLLLASDIFVTVSSERCKKINSCSCAYESNSVVDLSPLEGNPELIDQYGKGLVWMYTYSPCKPITEGGCKNVSMCEFNGTVYHDLGTQDSATFTDDPKTGHLLLSFASTDKAGTTRKSQITLLCDHDGPGNFTVMGQTSDGLYHFELESPYCCPNGTSPIPPSGGGSSSSGLSAGSVLLIIFFTILIVYFLAGFLYSKIATDAQGADAVPHREFWTALPGLARDGVLFVVRGGKGTYNEI